MIKQLLDSEWLKRLQEFTHLIVGFSGGLDSTVLLHVLASHPFLQNKLLAVYVNHGISSNAFIWENHCRSVCQNLNIPFISKAVQVDSSSNLEENARKARYDVFTSLLTSNSCLILAHHRDDQAETLLLQLFRGAGIDGLAAMAELSALGAGTLVRPLLSVTRAELEEYAALHQLEWIEDESNEDIHYSRNYLRHQIMPLLEQRWPGVVGNISRTASHCQEAKINLESLAIQDCSELSGSGHVLNISSLLLLHFERITNVIRLWLKKNDIQLPSTVVLYRLIKDVIFARADAVPKISWNNIRIYRYQNNLYLEKPEPLSDPKHKITIHEAGISPENTSSQALEEERGKLQLEAKITKSIASIQTCVEWTNFPKPLLIPQCAVELIAEKVKHGLVIPSGHKIWIGFRQGGEHIFWRGQTKQLKKLFQEWKIPPWKRDEIPLIYINDKLAVVVGYAVSDLFYSEVCSRAWKITVKN